MTLKIVYSWIFSMIILNHGIITISSIPLSIDELFGLGLNLLMDHFFYNNNDEEGEEITMTDIVTKIDDIEKTIKSSEKRIINEIRHIIKYENAIWDFTTDVSYIIEMYDLFKEYSSGHYENRTLKKFAEDCIATDNTGLTYKLNNLMDLISPKVEYITPLFHLVVEPYSKPEGAAQRCNKPLSAQQEVYKMYEEVVIFLIKGYIMKFNAYNILRKFDNVEYRDEKKLTGKHFKQAMRRLTKAAVAAMRVAPRDIRSCDSESHQEGETHIELKWLFNGVLIMERALSYQRTCFYTCEDYRHSTLSHVKSMCNGELFDCTYSYATYVCPGTKGGRRYDAAGSWDVAKAQCVSPLEAYYQSFVSMDDSDSELGIGLEELFYRCDTCLCACDDPLHEHTIRDFSLMAVESKTSENKVITGLRFVRKGNSPISIQIQEGKLGPNGHIRESTVEWQPIYTRDSWNKWVVKYGRKTVDLDTLAFPTGHVMTGIKFYVQNEHLKLSVRAHQFNYSSGVLDDRHGHWAYNNITAREQIKIEAPDIPTEANSENIVTSGDYQSIDFRMTDWDKDLAQTAVPFLDAQSVVSDPPRPLSGAGLYYRGQTGYGGFIALKLEAYDYAEVLAQTSLSRPRSIVKDAKEGTDDTEEE